MNADHKKIIAIVGPTAVGKSKVAIHLAQKIQGEIINADSMQVYRYMDIGTAKPTPEERKKIPHHLIDIAYPHENFTVADYQKLALQEIRNVQQRGKFPILVGGTGLYVRAVTSGYVFWGAKPNKQLRQKIENTAKQKGLSYLYNLLKEVDSETAKKIHPHDLRRLVRALEFYYSTGQKISHQWELTRGKKKATQMFGLYMPRELLYERIDQRVDKMIREGFLEEVRYLQRQGYSFQHKSMQSLGYKHMLKYLRGDWSFAEAVNFMKRDTRRYAKRQLTWFKKEEEILWIELTPSSNNNMPGNLDSILKRICIVLEG